MEFWILILFIAVFSLWVQSRLRRRNEDQRFANVIEALNRLEPRLNELKKLETRVRELEQHLASTTQPASMQPPAASAPSPPAPKPVELPPPVTLPPPPSPKPAVPPSAPPSVHPVTPRPAPPSLSLPPQPAPVSAREFSSQIEETLGKNWLNKLGIIALVIGISLFL